MHILAVEKVEALALDAGVLVLTAQIYPVLSLQTSVFQTCKPKLQIKIQVLFLQNRVFKNKLMMMHTKPRLDKRELVFCFPQLRLR